MPTPLSPSQLKEFLEAFIKGRRSALVTGAPGICKSDVMNQATAAAGADIINMHPSISDPSKVQGLAWPDAQKMEANFLPYGDFKRALNATRPTVLHFDDLGQATPAMQAAVAQIFHASTNSRRIGDHVLPECVVPMASSNLRTHNSNVQGMLEMVKSRFVSIVEVHPNLEDSCNWFTDNGYPSELVSFLRFRPTLLHGWTVYCGERCKKFVVVGATGQCPECQTKLQSGPSKDMVNSPSPRTWAHVGEIIPLGMSPYVELASIQGAVGEGAAAEFVAFLRVARELPSFDGILLDPDTAPLPTRSEALWAVAVGLASKATAGNFARIATYAERMRRAARGEYAGVLIRDAFRRNPDVCDTPAFIRLMAGDLGRLVRGE